MVIIREICSDVDGNLSSRRIAMFICLGMLLLEEILFYFTNRADSGITSAISTITVAVIAGVAADRFGKC